MNKHLVKLVVILGIVMLVMSALLACDQPAPAPAPAPAPTPTPAPAPKPAPVPQVIKWKLHTAYPSGGNNIINFYTMFADLVREHTDGQLDIEVMWAGALGYKGTEIVQVLGSGACQISEVWSALVGSQIGPWMEIPQWTSYTTDNAKQYHEYLALTRPDYDEAFKSGGLVPIMFNYFVADEGNMATFTTKKEIRSLADLKGTKARIYHSLVAASTLKPMGMEPLFMPGSEVYMALKTGLIDGNWGQNIGDVVNNKYYEVCNYSYAFRPVYWGEPLGMATGKQSFDALPADVQEGLLRAGKEFEKKWREIEANPSKFGIPTQLEYLDIAREKGMTVKMMPKEIRDEADRLTMEGFKEWAEETGPEAKKVTNLFFELKKQYPNVESPLWDKLIKEE